MAATTNKDLGTIALTGINGKVLCVDQNNACAFTRSWIREWERIVVIGLPDGQVAFRSWNNLYLHAAADQYHVWFCATSIGQNESFDMVFAGSKMAIKTHFGKYLTCEMDSEIKWLVCRAPWNGPWEQFSVTMCSGSFQDLVSYKTNLENEKRRTAEKQRLEAEQRRLQQQLDRQRAEHRAECERRSKEEKRRQKEDAVTRIHIIEQSLRRVDQHIDDSRTRLATEESTLASINAKLVEETLARSKFEAPQIGEYIKIVLMGKTGDGKSTTGNRLLGDTSRKGNEGAFATSDAKRSKTQKIQTEFLQFPLVNMCIVDTPGFGDSGGRDRIHQTNLVDFLHGIGEVHAFAFIWNFRNRRLDIETQGVFRRMTRMLGVELWKNVVIVMTNVDDEDDMEELAERERDLPNEIGDMFGLSFGVVSRIQVVAIGKRTYQTQCPRIFEAFLSCNDGVPFSSEGLVAPVEERQAEFAEQANICSQLQNKIEQLVQDREELLIQKRSAEAIVEKLS